MIEVKPLTDETLSDAEQVIRHRFDASAISVLQKALKNPFRKNIETVGFVGYEDGEPVAFEAQMMRNVYLGRKQIIGRIGGLSCVKNRQHVEAFLDVRFTADRNYRENSVSFGNTQIEETANLAKRNKNACIGPDSYSRVCWGVVHPVDSFLYAVRRKVLRLPIPKWKPFSTLDSNSFCMKRNNLSFKRLLQVVPDFFDVLMSEYLKTNEGLVSSRTAEEIEWAYGDRIRTGEDVLLAAHDNDRPVGYIILRMLYGNRRALVIDWFAMGNDLKILEELLVIGKLYLKRHTPAMILEMVGFPTYVQPMIRKHLSHSRPIGHNMFSWGSKSYRDELLPIIDTPKSWFFGPYDGDAFM